MSRLVTILGSTGSIGKSTLSVISRHTDQYQVRALTANTDVESMTEQCLRWHPQFAVMCDESAAQQLNDVLRKQGSKTEVLSGVQGLCQVASLDDVDTVVAGIVGAAGLLPSLAAAEAGKRILLANKEALVMSGQLFMDAVENNNAELLPVDSEHNAIFQCMPVSNKSAGNDSGINKILLTASGGPFRTFSNEKLVSVTPEQAVNHPNWEMGPKISVDSSTLMNKGLEVIEAHWLFGVALDDIEVVVHPQSVIHSMVSYADGSVLAQLGNPDMRTPIAHALAFPDRMVSGVEPLDLFEVAKLEFEKPDFQRFPCLRLCYEAIRMGGTASIILNAANEIAVASFLENKIAYTDIADVIEQSLESMTVSHDVTSIESILAADNEARNTANEHIAKKQQL